MTPEAAPSLNRSSSMRFRASLQSDSEAVARLINAAFVVERPIFDGDRTSPDGVRVYMEKGKFLLAEDSSGLAG